MYNYVTLQAMRDYIGNLSGITDRDELLTELLDWSARLVEGYKGRRYDVRRETRVYDTPQAASTAMGAYDYRIPVGGAPKLRLDDDLLAVIRLTNGDGTTLTTAHYVLRPDNGTPKNRIELRSGYTWAEADAGPEQAISLEGWWGYHDRYGEAWRAATTLSAGINDSTISVTVTSLSGIEIGQLIQVGTELMLIEDLDAVSKTLVVERGANGSQAAAHLSGAALAIYRPMGWIVQAVTRLVKWRYSQLDADNFDQSYVAGTGIVSTPSALPADVTRILGAPKARIL